MAMRSITYCVEPLQVAWWAATTEWAKLYHNAPKPVLTCTYRPKEEQAALYAQPWDKKDNDGDGQVDEANEKVTNAKSGQSAHNYNPSYAFDFAFLNGKKLDWNPALFTQFWHLIRKPDNSLTWGGNWKMRDYPHIELTGWKNLVA